MTPITDVATAWKIVRDADRPNGGILFDTWHFFRGSADFDALEAVPGERILAVQVDDAHAEVTGSLWDDTQQRLLPGDGSFDLPRVLRTLGRIGGLRFVGPEVISPVTAAMPAGRSGRLREYARWSPTPSDSESDCVVRAETGSARRRLQPLRRPHRERTRDD